MAQSSNLHIVERHIYLIRGYKVILAFHLAQLYEVELRALIQAVKYLLNKGGGSSVSHKKQTAEAESGKLNPMAEAEGSWQKVLTTIRH